MDDVIRAGSQSGEDVRVAGARAIVEPQTSAERMSAPRHVPLVQIVFVNKYGDESFVPPTSDPRPVVTLDTVTVADVTLLGDGTRARVKVSGTVTDALADFFKEVCTLEIGRIRIRTEALTFIDGYINEAFRLVEELATISAFTAKG